MYINQNMEPLVWIHYKKESLLPNTYISKYAIHA